MARKITCDECGDEFPHVVPCPDCDGSGDHTTDDDVLAGQCSQCRGKGTISDPSEGKGFQMTVKYDDGRMIYLNMSVSAFHKDQPDLCGTCLPKVVFGAIRKGEES